MIDQLIDWSIDRSIDWSVDWLIEHCIAGITASNAVRLQAAVPGVDVYEHCTAYDGRLNYIHYQHAASTSVNRTLWQQLHRLFHNLSCISATCLVLVTCENVSVDNDKYYCYYKLIFKTVTSNRIQWTRQEFFGEQVVRVIWQKGHIAVTHGLFSRICQMAPMCTPI